MRVAVAIISYFVVAFGVPVPPDTFPPKMVHRGDMPTKRNLLEQASKLERHGDQLAHPTLQHSQAETTSRLPASNQAQLSSQAHIWGPQFNQHFPLFYQPNQNAGLPLFPAQTQYQYQMPQFVYFPMFGAPARSPTLTYAMPAFYPTSPVHFPANSGPAVSADRPTVPGRPVQRVQVQSPTLGNRGQSSQQQPRQPYQQQTPQIVYVVQQPMTQPFGGISSEEIQAQRHLGHLGRPLLVPPGSTGPFVPLSHPANQPVNPGFPAISSAAHPVLFPSVPAMPNIPSVQLPNPTLPNFGQPVEETLSTFGALPNVPEAAISAERMLPSPASPSHSSVQFEKAPPTNPTIMAPTVTTENPLKPTASVVEVYS